MLLVERQVGGKEDERQVAEGIKGHGGRMLIWSRC